MRLVAKSCMRRQSGSATACSHSPAPRIRPAPNESRRSAWIPQPRRVTLLERARRAAWSPTGHLLFDRDGVLLAVPFDLDALKPTGVPFVVLQAETASPNTFGALSIDVSRRGTLAYSPINYGKRRIVLMNRDGSSRPLDQPPGVTPTRASRRTARGWPLTRT